MNDLKNIYLYNEQLRSVRFSDMSGLHRHYKNGRIINEKYKVLKFHTILNVLNKDRNRLIWNGPSPKHGFHRFSGCK